jgi:hypothetical protein
VKDKGKPVVSHLYVSRKNFLVFSLLTLFFLPVRSGAQAGTTEHIAWQSLATKYTIIHYQSTKDLKKFYAKVKYGPKNWGLKVLFFGTCPDVLMEMTSKKVDLVFEKVQKILGMRKKMDKININIYRDKAQLNEAYSEIYPGTCRIRAWYRHANNTVYLNLNDLQEGMLAHELTHAIVDHYLLVRPPHATAEILARHVDSHLKGTLISYNTSEQFFGFSD